MLSLHLAELYEVEVRALIQAVKRNKDRFPLDFVFQSSVLHSPRAVQVNIAIMRAFVKLREMLASHKDFSQKLEQLEKKYDAQFKIVFDAIRKLIIEEAKPKRGIGFHVR